MSEPSPPRLLLHCRDVHVEYAVREDRLRGARSLVANRLRNRSTATVHAVRGVTLNVREGEAVGVIGRNGSGKSTLMRALAGLAPVTAGTVLAETEPSLLGVNAVLVRDLSGAQNVLLGCLALGMDKSEVRRRFRSIVEFAGIGDAIDRPMHTYSSGMAARLRFAIATAVVPRVLIVDEALATGDAGFKERARGRLQAVRDEAGAVLLVTHSVNELRSNCTRAIWMDAGRVVLDGTPDDVAQAYAATSKATGATGAA